MAFPYDHETNFETGDATEWDGGETDTTNILDFPHYSTLAASGMTPYSGAYCMRVKPAGAATTAVVTEAAMNLAADATSYFRFNLLFGDDFTATADEAAANIFELKAGATVEAAFGFKVTAATDAIQLGIGETAPTSFGASAIERGKWYTIELHVEIDAGGGNDGSIDIYVTEEGKTAAAVVYATQVGSLDQGAITDGLLGIVNQLATTTGTILIDNFVQDSERIYPNPRWPQQIHMTKSGHAFVGNGKIDQITLIGGNADNRLYVYDSDIAANDVAANTVGSLIPTAVMTVQTDGPIQVKNGAYISLAGTNPRAIVDVGYGGAYGSNAVLVNYGRRR